MDLDLVIVGGGPAGIATALFFAAAAPHRAHRVVVLEKERYPRDKICAGAIGARADRLLEKVGVRVDVPSVPVRGFGLTVSGAPVRQRGEQVIGRVVRRIELDQAFAERARDRGLAIREGTRVTGLTFERSGVRVDTSAGPLRARAVVGADGVGSFVRRALGIPRGRWLAQVVEADTRPIGADDPHRDLLSFDLSDASLTGYGWDFPTIVNGEPLVSRGLYELHLEGQPERAPGPDVGARLMARMERLGVADGVKIKRFAERGLALHEPVARARALLVGEAAGIDPALGEGIAQAIFYGATAGAYLASRLDRDDLAFTDWPRVLGASPVGVDLRLRAACTPWLYGRKRPLFERWVESSTDLTNAGMRYFAGDRVPRGRLARAAAHLGVLALGMGVRRA